MKKKHPNLFFEKRSIITLLFVFGIFAHVFGQINLSGTVRDDTGAPLPGANIVEKGSTNGTITDINGKFNLAVTDENSTIIISFIGLTEQEIVVGNQRVFSVDLVSDLTDLDEVVVVGYGAMKKSHLTGAIAKLETKGLEDIPSSRADQVLQGRVAGVQIQNTTSQVGESPNINIRGTGSISANGQPLVIVDGFPISDGLSVVDVADIESMEVLKDAASAAIYGSRAANGVIIVTTKSGSEDKPQYNARVSYGVKEAHTLHPMMTNDEFIDMKIYEVSQGGQASTINGQRTLTDQFFAMSLIEGNTDWQDEALRMAGVLNAQFNVSGGKKGVRYYISSSYLGDEGIMEQNEYDRFNVRSRIDADLSDRVKVGITMTPTYTNRSKPTNNYTDFLRTPNWMPVYHNEQTSDITGQPIGSYAHGRHFSGVTYTGIDPITGEERTTGTGANPFNTSNNNPLSVMHNEFYSREDYRMQTSAYLDIKIIEGLNFRTSNGFNTTYTEENTYKNMNSKVASQPNSSYYQNRLFIDLLSENTFTYNKKVGKHSFNALVGFSIQERTTKTTGLYGTNFPTDLIRTLNAAGGILQYEDGDQVTGTWVEEEGLVSAFSRFAYSYNDKYLISASFRGDGSTKFGEDKRWGYFPSVSLGWRISEESFLKDNVAWMDQLKLRASYGVTGTDDIENYANTNTVHPNNYIFGSGNGSFASGISNVSTVLANNLLQWEQTNELNYGIDLSVVNNRINLSADYYYSITRSLLYQGPVNSIVGFTHAWSNEGKVRNKGFELVLNTHNISRNDFNWNTTFNFSLNRNRVLDLGGPEEIINTGEGSELYITRVGDPIVQFYGYKTDGVWLSQSEIESNPSNVADQPGGLRAVNTNGDNEITVDDYTVIGSPLPDFNWGITNTLMYKGFDLSFLFQGSQGGELINGDLRYNEVRRFNTNFNSGRWISEENPGDGNTPFMNNGINQMVTDYAVEDASYVSLRDLSIGYTIPKDMVRKAGFSNVRVYLSGQNLLYFMAADYRGVNPEARRTASEYSSPLIDGYQRGAFPVQRVYSAGLDISF